MFMSPSVHLADPLPDDRATIECAAAELRGDVVWLESADGEHLVVPTENLAGIEGGSPDREVEHMPTQGGQYSEVVTRIE